MTPDPLTLRGMIEDWAVLRDARLWDRFRPIGHSDYRQSCIGCTVKTDMPRIDGPERDARDAQGAAWLHPAG